METQNKYWMVHNTRSPGASVQHTDAASAETEARRLASKSPGDRFVVLEAVKAFVVAVPEPQEIQLVTRFPEAF